jgi:hypothetical protein
MPKPTLAPQLKVGGDCSLKKKRLNPAPGREHLYCSRLGPVTAGLSSPLRADEHFVPEVDLKRAEPSAALSALLVSADAFKSDTHRW